MSNKTPATSISGPSAVTLSSPLLSPPKDAIHPSEDVISPPKDDSLAKDSGREIEGESEDDSKDVLKSLIPLDPKPKWPNWSIDYLRAVIECRTDGEAARRIGLSYQTVYEARLSQADFAAAWDNCRKYRDSLIVSDLEDVTLSRALKADPADRMSATLALAHLKARDDKYKDKQQMGGVAIQINLGYQIPDTKRGNVTLNTDIGQ